MSKGYIAGIPGNDNGGSDPAPTDTTYVKQGVDWLPAYESVPTIRLMWSTNTIDPPGIDEISGDSNDLALITELRVNRTLSNGADLKFVLEKLKVNNSMYGVVDQKSESFGGYTITGDTVDNGTYFTIPVIAETAGVNPSDGDPLLLSVIATDCHKLRFIVSSETDQTISIDPNNPSHLLNGVLDPKSFGSGFNPLDGSFQNLTGREIPQLTGTISFQPDKTGGGVTVLHLWSERSLDGITWTQNAKTLRVIEVSNNGETFKTSLSAVTEVKPNEMFRFNVYAFSGGSLLLSSPTDTVLGGQVIIGQSWVWELSEA